MTCDVTPPPVAFLATSGGLFRDCSVHDFDVIRWITGREVVEVYARGSNNGDPAIGEVGDVDSALAVCTLDDGTLAVVSASRYNGAGHDVRLELQGSQGTLVVGLDERTAVRSAEPGVGFPAGVPHTTFAERFAEAYRAEIAAFAGSSGRTRRAVPARGRRRRVQGRRRRAGVAAHRGTGPRRLTRPQRVGIVVTSCSTYEPDVTTIPPPEGAVRRRCRRWRRGR